MRTSFRLALALVPAFATLWGAEAHAQQRGDWYAAVSGSLTSREDADGTIANAPAPGSTVLTKSPFEPGIGGQFAVGRRFGSLRLEVELGYTRDSQDRYQAIVPPTGQIFADVTEERIRGMVNGYVDFDMGTIKPYLGAGLGYASTDLLFVAPRAPFPTEQPRSLIDDSDGGVAWQAIAGFAAPLNDRIDVTVQYRWLDAGTFEAVDSRRERITRDTHGGNVDVGLRMSF